MRGEVSLDMSSERRRRPSLARASNAWQLAQRSSACLNPSNLYYSCQLRGICRSRKSSEPHGGTRVSYTNRRSSQPVSQHSNLAVQAAGGTPLPVQPTASAHIPPPSRITSPSSHL